MLGKLFRIQRFEEIRKCLVCFGAESPECRTRRNSLFFGRERIDFNERDSVGPLDPLLVCRRFRDSSFISGRDTNTNEK